MDLMESLYSPNFSCLPFVAFGDSDDDAPSSFLISILFFCICLHLGMELSFYWFLHIVVGNGNHQIVLQTSGDCNFKTWLPW